jgi:Nucleotide-diphospho-sugar transferase
MAANVADARRNLIITFCSSSYSGLLKNWLTAMERLGQFPVLVCALDKALADTLRVEGVPVVCIPCKIDLSDIWSVRTKTIRDLVAAGFNVTQSDVDAVWLRDPRPLMKSLDADIISSQGSVYPNSCLNVWGHVLCCGFIEFRSTGAAKNLLDELAELAGEEPFDDQKSLNELLMAKGMVWSKSNTYQINFKDQTFVCSREPISGESCLDPGLGIRVIILPHAQVRRIPNDKESWHEVYVCHPYCPSAQRDTATVLNENNCWFMHLEF